ncbi:hypothetical protein KDW_07790 [Dictyobacter vulcani]|uniref:Uncharacterized protein n=1 Tax=Dictyobacter vulcani TaxID=2607529 RepID=A0A5J4KJK8_9CHLR|nr:hypothetical protein KDW_07790 [Dictyobacter vulcani]
MEQHEHTRITIHVVPMDQLNLHVITGAEITTTIPPSKHKVIADLMASVRAAIINAQSVLMAINRVHAPDPLITATALMKPVLISQDTVIVLPMAIVLMMGVLADPVMAIALPTVIVLMMGILADPVMAVVLPMAIVLMMGILADPVMAVVLPMAIVLMMGILADPVMAVVLPMAIAQVRDMVIAAVLVKLPIIQKDVRDLDRKRQIPLHQPSPNIRLARAGLHAIHVRTRKPMGVAIHANPFAHVLKLHVLPIHAG